MSTMFVIMNDELRFHRITSSATVRMDHHTETVQGFNHDIKARTDSSTGQIILAHHKTRLI